MRVINGLALDLLLAIAGGTSLAQDKPADATLSLAVGAQYDTAHVYVAPADLDRFSDSLIATFGGTKSQKAELTITPTPSKTNWQAVLHSGWHVLCVRFHDADPISVRPRTNRLPRDRHGCSDPIGESQRSRRCRGTVQRSHWARCHRSVAGRHIYAALLAYDRAELREARQGPRKQGVRVTGSRRCVCPRFRGVLAREDRLRRPERTRRRGGPTKGYLPPRADQLHIREDRRARYRWTAPYPYGREISGYEVANLADTVSKAKATGATVLVDPYTADRRQAAIISFPGGYIAEIYSAVGE